MLTRDTPARIADRWGGGPPPGADDLGQIVYLSNLIGQEPRLVQPGGGNTSIKVGDALLVKGSGTDLRTIGPKGFTRLSLPALAPLRTAETMSDAAMMRFMARAMLERDRRRASKRRFTPSSPIGSSRTRTTFRR